MVDNIENDVNDISKPERANSVGPVTGGADEKTGQESTGDFSSYMKDKQVPESSPTSSNPSPVEVQKASKAASTPGNIETVQGQINTTNTSLNNVKNQLHTKGLKLKQGEKQATRDKLSEANENIRAANKKLGGDPGPPVDLRSSKNPIAKYLSLVSDGQQQLASATNMISKLGKKKGQVNPANMLLVQVKLAKAQQALDFTSVLLGKAVEFLKTTMQTQI